MVCTNKCNHSKDVCNYCKEHYDVSPDFYKAKRPANGCWVTGYLVKRKNGQIEGILNKNNHFHELAWIDESTLEIV